MSIHFNGIAIESFDDIALGVLSSGQYALDGDVENTLVIRYEMSNGVANVFPGDPRDLVMLFRRFSVHRAGTADRAPDSGRLDLSFASHVGDPEANARLVQEEYETGQTVLRGLPPVVTLALTTRCNNKAPCVICDRNTRPQEADRDITPEIIAKAEPLIRTARYLLLHCGGEAMLSPYFDEVISMIDPPTRVSFATNAMLMTKKRADRMLAKDIMGGFVVSMDAATDKTYRIMRPGSVFDTVVSNVAYFIDRAKALGRDESKVTLNMTVCESNVHEVPMLVDLAESVGAWGVDFNHLNVGPTHVVRASDGSEWNYVEQARFKDKDFHDEMLLEAYYRAKEKGIHFALVGRPFLGSNAEKYQDIVCDMTCQVAFQEGEGQTHWDSPHHRKVAQGVPACFKPWQETVIQPDGVVRACYFHDAAQWTLGSLSHMDFMSIWNSESMVTIREQFLDNSFARCCAESQPCMHRGRT